MQIWIRGAEDNARSDWTIIELQGDLESRLGETSMERKFIGDLHFSRASSGAPILIIGHHILYGKEVVLDKPIVAVEKVMASGDETDETSATEYVVKAIVRKKLLFKTRPKPIIANVPKKYKQS